MNPCEDCHRPVGVHCCHNCKKDANKCNEYHGCGSCDAWEQGIFTNADRIRAMSDEELVELLEEIYDAGYEQGVALFYGSDDRNRFIWDKGWLKQPAKEEE